MEFAAIYWLKKRLETTTDEELVNKILLQIVVSYLKLRDFVNAFYYMEIYVQEDHPEADKIRNCKSELEAALKRISDYIKEKNSNNIIIYLVDAVDYIDYPNIPFLKERSKSCLVFEHSYTVTPYTSSSLQSMFCNEKVMENEFYKKGLMDEHNSTLLFELKRRGYDFTYLSPERRFFVCRYIYGRKGKYGFRFTIKLDVDSGNL